MNTCGTCKAFLIFDGDDTGSCNLHPPVVTESGSLWPVVNCKAWCLDWRAKDAVD